MNAIKTIQSIAICLFLAALSLLSSAAFAQVATVAELTGTATAGATQPAAAPGAPAAPAPVRRALRLGDTVNQGETVSAGAMSSIVLRFTDGQVTALSANSSMAINNYTYNQAEPAKSNMLLSLLNGGMRAVTGLIGKAKPENVNYRAGNATIGIRGTDVVLGLLDKNLVVSVVGGQISFSLNGNTVSIPAGQGTYINFSNPNAPVVVVSAADLRTATNIASLSALGNLLSVLTSPASTAAFSRLGAFTAGTVQTTNQSTTLTGTLGTGNAGGQTSGGGSTLPNCSLVSPVASQRPGENCIRGQ